MLDIFKIFTDIKTFGEYSLIVSAIIFTLLLAGLIILPWIMRTLEKKWENKKKSQKKKEYETFSNEKTDE